MSHGVTVTPDSGRLWQPKFIYVFCKVLFDSKMGTNVCRVRWFT